MDLAECKKVRVGLPAVLFEGIVAILASPEDIFILHQSWRKKMDTEVRVHAGCRDVEDTPC